jgi:hypothetical protein
VRGLLLILTAMLAVASIASAQRGMPVGRFGAPHAPISSHYAPMSSHFFRNALPFFTDSLFYDDLLSSGYPVASQPPLIIMQAMPPASPAPAQVPAPAEALLIERQGDHYVRLSGAKSAGDQLIDQMGSPDRLDVQPTSTARATAPERTSAVLVFRDGHREEVSEYSVANGILYATGSYYADGSWTKKIELSALNLPETVDANRARAVPFKLPTTPNEVVVGP